jgi:hypothetical protein
MERAVAETGVCGQEVNYQARLERGWIWGYSSGVGYSTVCWNLIAWFIIPARSASKVWANPKFVTALANLYD